MLAADRLLLAASLALVVAGCGNNPPAEDLGAPVDQREAVDLRGAASDLEGDLAPEADLRGPVVTPDLWTSDDRTTPPDLAGPTDLAVPADLAVPWDLATPLDLATPIDLATPVDLGPPGDLAGPGDLPPPPDFPMLPDLPMMVDLATPRDGGPDGSCAVTPPPTVDFAVPPSGKMIPAGNVGSACTMNADCKQGTGTKSCWKTNLFNNPMYYATPGGYCSATCTTDADCGPGNFCVDFGGPGQACLAGCEDAVTCRHPGYACWYLGGASSACFVTAGLDCNPKLATCTTGAGDPGGCGRVTIEDDPGGICQPTCKVGDSCADSTTQCLYIDYTQYGDGFRGMACISSSATPAMPGDPCTYENDCIDGYQCDNRAGGTNRCVKLCDLGGAAPRCAAGSTCTKAFATCEAGLCL